MEMTLTRTAKRKNYTIGALNIDDEYFCDTLEPTWRDLGPSCPGHKIAGRTAIPEGRYPVVITWSPKFGQWLPLLLHVPLFPPTRRVVSSWARIARWGMCCTPPVTSPC